MLSSRPVIVMQVPERLYKADCEAFQNELKVLWQTERPRIVLDCSEVRHLDSIGVEMLLHCMDEAMKRDGDVKLAGVTPSSAVILELMKVDRLFEIFDTADDAVQSFQAIPIFEIAQEPAWIPGTSSLEAAS